MNLANPKTKFPQRERVKRHGFTLIELLIVIAILAVLATVAIVIINPTEILKNGRDSRRLSELQAINKVLQIAESQSSNIYFGSSSVVYVSIPDTSPICSNLGLSTSSLPSGWSYACRTQANFRKTDGLGWIPVNFSSLAIGSPFSALPVDPINTISSSQYYTYVTGGSWHLSATLESSKFAEKAAKDGGNDSAMLEIGNNLSIAPFAHGLVGYWKFDEASGITANDSSGFGNNGTLTDASSTNADGNTPPISTSTAKIGRALSFDGVDDYVLMQPSSNFGTITGWTVGMWINGIPPGSNFNRLWNATEWNPGFIFALTANNALRVYSWDTEEYSLTTSDLLVNNIWQYVSFTWNGNTGEIKIYINGALSISSFSTTNSFAYNDKQFEINGSNDGLFYTGKIDDVRIYNRALSASQIKAIYDATK